MPNTTNERPITTSFNWLPTKEVSEFLDNVPYGFKQILFEIAINHLIMSILNRYGSIEGFLASVYNHQNKTDI